MEANGVAGSPTVIEHSRTHAENEIVTDTVQNGMMTLSASQPCVHGIHERFVIQHVSGQSVDIPSIWCNNPCCCEAGRVHGLTQHFDVGAVELPFIPYPCPNTFQLSASQSKQHNNLLHGRW